MILFDLNLRSFKAQDITITGGKFTDAASFLNIDAISDAMLYELTGLAFTNNVMEDITKTF